MSAAALIRSRKSPCVEKRCRVAIAEDNEFMREGMAAVLRRQSRLEICGVAADRRSTLKLVEKEKPDVLLLSFLLENCDVIDLIKDIIARFPQTRLIVTAMLSAELYCERLLRAGAFACLPRSRTSASELIDTVRSAVAGKSGGVRQTRGQIEPAAASISSLTDRELHVFRLIGRGVGTGDIARELGLSRKTIETYREKIKRKLGYRDTGELHRGAFEWARRIS